MDKITDYIASAMQVPCYAINRYETRREASDIISNTIQRISKQIFGAKKFIGSHLRLVVLPEYFLTGFPTRESVE